MVTVGGGIVMRNTKIDSGHRKAGVAPTSLGVDEPTKRAAAEQLRNHLDADTSQALASLHPERQTIVLMSLRQQIEMVRDVARAEHEKLVSHADVAHENDARDRAKLAMFEQRSDASIVNDLQDSVKRSVARQKLLQQQYKRSADSDRSSMWIALFLTFLVLVFVIGGGLYLARGDNLYRVLKLFHRVADYFSPSSRQGTLFNEAGGDLAYQEEYAYYS
jgi:hypothetical protein